MCTYKSCEILFVKESDDKTKVAIHCLKDKFPPDYFSDTISHDLLHHVNGYKNIGPLWDELQAFGVRYWFAKPKLNNFYVTNIAAWVFPIYFPYFHPPELIKYRSPKNCMFTDTLKECLINYSGIYISRNNLDVYDLTENIHNFIDCCTYNIHKGFIKANKKYGKIGHKRITELYTCIENTIETKQKHINSTSRTYSQTHKLFYGVDINKVYAYLT